MNHGASKAESPPAQEHPGEIVFGGSPFVRWSLGIAVAFFAVAWPFFVEEWTTKLLTVVGIGETVLVLFLLAVVSPRRFAWAGRAVTGTVFLCFLSYAVDRLLCHRVEPSLPQSRAEGHWWNAVQGLVWIGLPCLWYTVTGSFRLPWMHRPDDGGPPIEEKLDTARNWPA